MILHLIEGDRRSIQKQNVDTVQIQEAEEEIAIQKIIEDLEVVAREIGIKNVTVVAQADLTLQTVLRRKLGLLQEKSHEVPQVVHNQINQRLILKKTKL